MQLELGWMVWSNFPPQGCRYQFTLEGDCIFGRHCDSSGKGNAHFSHEKNEEPEDKKKESMESNLTGRSDHKFLTRQVMLGSHMLGI